MDDNQSQLPMSELQEFKDNIVLNVVFVILTCGIYDIFWQYRQMKFINILAMEERMHFGRWLLFTILTCGLYNLYHEYVMARELVDLQAKHSLPMSNDLPGISVIVSIISLGIIADAIQQYEMNMMIDRLSGTQTV